MEYSQIKQPFALLQKSSSTHLNVHSSHLNGRLLLWVSLCQAIEILRVQHVLALHIGVDDRWCWKVRI